MFSSLIFLSFFLASNQANRWHRVFKVANLTPIGISTSGTITKAATTKPTTATRAGTKIMVATAVAPTLNATITKPPPYDKVTDNRTGREIRRFHSMYNSVVVSGQIRASVRVDYPERVEISGPSDLFSHVITNLTGQQLTVTSLNLTPEFSWYTKILIILHSQCNNISITADIASTIDLDASLPMASMNWLFLTLKSSASLNGNISVQGVNSTVDRGAGALTLTGRAATHGIVIRGSGLVNAESLVTEITDIDILGSGLLRVFAKSTISGKSHGSVLIYYKSAGNPRLAVTSNYTEFVEM